METFARAVLNTLLTAHHHHERQPKLCPRVWDRVCARCSDICRSLRPLVCLVHPKNISTPNPCLHQLVPILRECVFSLMPAFPWLTTLCLVIARVTAFIIRAILAGSNAAGEDWGLLIGDQILFSVGFFGLLYSAYTLVLDRYASSIISFLIHWLIMGLERPCLISPQAAESYHEVCGTVDYN
jgi:hypothetical protein